ncbi:MAG: M48 family metalloprotease [Bryobacterales bacterium]|nr:M48 family metalloprotease [Bryobacterales bacterium]
MKDLCRRNPVIEDALIQAYIDGAGQRLAARMTADLAWKFQVVQGDWEGQAREPAALPGGFVLVPSTLLAAGSEGGFIRLLAHAMAHVAERHGVVRVDRAPAASPAPLIYQGWFPFGLRQWTPAEEAEADRIASRAAAGFEPDPGFPAVLRRLRELRAPAVPPLIPSLRRPDGR